MTTGSAVGTGGAATRAARRADEPRHLRRARVVLLVGAVLAIAAAFGPVWVVRVGVALALIGGGVACWLLWRTLQTERHAATERLLAHSRAHGAALHAERQHGAEVLATLSQRLDATRHSLTRARADLVRAEREVADLRHRLATQRGDNAVLRLRLADRETERREAAEVVAMPRRGRPAGREPRSRAREA